MCRGHSQRALPQEEWGPEAFEHSFSLLIWSASLPFTTGKSGIILSLDVRGKACSRLQAGGPWALHPQGCTWPSEGKMVETCCSHIGLSLFPTSVTESCDVQFLPDPKWQTSMMLSSLLWTWNLMKTNISSKQRQQNTCQTVPTPDMGRRDGHCSQEQCTHSKGFAEPILRLQPQLKKQGNLFAFLSC